MNLTTPMSGIVLMILSLALNALVMGARAGAGRMAHA